MVILAGYLAAQGALPISPQDHAERNLLMAAGVIIGMEGIFKTVPLSPHMGFRHQITTGRERLSQGDAVRLFNRVNITALVGREVNQCAGVVGAALRSEEH